MFLNSLPDSKILDWSKLKEFADNKMNVTNIMKFVLGRVKNILGKGENAAYQHFLLLPKCFQKLPFSVSSKSGLCGKELILSKTTNFRLFQTGKVCRRQFQIC